MATISDCQSITAWLEKSPVISDTALWQGALLAIHSHHPVIIITTDIENQSNFKLAHCYLSYTRKHRQKKKVCPNSKYTKHVGCMQKHRATQKKEQRLKAKSHRIHHQRKHYSQTLMFPLSQPFARQKLLMSRGEKVKIQQTSPANSPHI